LVGVEVAVGYGCSVLDGGWPGSATKARKPKAAARVGEGAEAVVAQKVCMVVVGGKHAQVLKVGKAGDGKVVAGP
jgi:hypothetical protein